MDIKKIFKNSSMPRPYQSFEEINADIKQHGPFLLKVDSIGNRIFKTIDVVTERKNGQLSIRMGRDLYCPETILDEYAWQDGTAAGYRDND